jgi:Asp-tRNA(Asn)/Glu-tRNA(Gln) amidotransferase B subunit
MLLVDDFLKRWESIVEQVDKEHVPIDCVKKIVFRTHNRRQKTINLRHLRSQGLDDEDVERLVARYIEENEEAILSMEFVLDVEAVAGLLQPETDKLLKGMK